MKAIDFVKAAAAHPACCWTMTINERDLKPLCGEILPNQYYIVSCQPWLGLAQAMGKNAAGEIWYAYLLEE